ncbi:NHL repeat containing protein [Oopsacas minuta]|uniref:NHL repeat containing protein n=1 Tax=Oopsacas minuta TaxID=111878 RepID=A0AAV7JC22_9METZ|nr:NHL repeat containing protein [Oopsacas minuta]
MTSKPKLKRGFSQFGLASNYHSELTRRNFLKTLNMLREDVNKKFGQLILSLQYRRSQLLSRIEEIEKEFTEQTAKMLSLRQSLELELREKMFSSLELISISTENEYTEETRDLYMDKMKDQILKLKLYDFPHYRDIRLIMDDSLPYHLYKTGRILLGKSDPPQPFRVFPHQKSGMKTAFTPLHVKADTNNHMYFLNKDNGRELCHFDPDGELLSTGAIQREDEKEIELGSLALSNDLIYVSISNLHQLQVYDKTSLYFIHSIGTRGMDKCEFSHPLGLAYSNKYIFICEWSNNRVQVLGETEDELEMRTYKFAHFIGHSCEIPGRLRRPQSVEISEDQRIVVLHHGNPCINLYGWEGQLISQVGGQNQLSELSAGAWGICQGIHGELIVSDFIQNSVFVFDKQGCVCLKIGGEGYEYGKFCNPSGVCVNSENTLVVCDTGNSRVQCFLLSTVIS